MEGCARAVPSPTLRRSRQGLVHNANSVLEPLASLLRWCVARLPGYAASRSVLAGWSAARLPPV